MRYVPLTPDEILALRLAIPELNASLIPAGTYPSLMYGYETVGLYNFAVARRDLPLSLVYEIVRGGLRQPRGDAGGPPRGGVDGPEELREEHLPALP